MKIARLQNTSLLALLLTLTACSSSVLETVRKVTYPPDFSYISKQKLQSTMHQFAWYTTLLDNSLRDTSAVSLEQRQNAISILNKMETLSLELGTQSLSSNHNIVSFNIDQFRHNIVNARTGLEQEPPNYYLAGSVSGYCLNCHASGDDAIPK